MKELSKGKASWREVGEEGDGQRVDNYLTRLLKGVPKSHIYRILRSGEVRVNSARVKAEHRLSPGDKIRLPPIRTGDSPAAASQPRKALKMSLESCILHEDDFLLIINKPSGMAVHGGSGISLGVVEHLRQERPASTFLELVHRLDRDTSGLLLLAKKRATLLGLHEQLRLGQVRKIYLAGVKGQWCSPRQSVKLALKKYLLPGGERRVRVDPEGAAAHTVFRLRKELGANSLIEAELKTGRTHQIRVHLAHLGFPILGDEKYGDYAFNRGLARSGLKRMFLHAHRIGFIHPATGNRVEFEAPLPADLARFLEQPARLA